MLLNQEKLELVLISHWTEFIDIRAAISFCKKVTEETLSLQGPIKLSNLSVTRFEPESSSNMYIVWFEYNIVNSGNKVKVTTECKINFEGLLKHVRTIEEFRQCQDA